MHCSIIHCDALILFTLLCFSCYIWSLLLLNLLGVVGYRAKASPGLFQMSTHVVEEEISKKADLYVENLQKTAETCEDDGVTFTSSCKDNVTV